MLERLIIQNIVLVKEADIAFTPGLNVLTGETGAGKSILLDALGLVLGERSDAQLVSAGADQASVSAEFMIAGIPEILEHLHTHGLTPESHIIIRRTLDAKGRSRAFINDTPVTLSLLKSLARLLVEQHSQHDQRMISDAQKQRDMLDVFAGATIERSRCAQAFGAFSAAKKEREALREQIEKTERERAFLQFMADEIAALKPQAGEEQMLADARAHMQQQEKAQAHVVDALAALMQPKEVSGQIRSAMRALERIVGDKSDRYVPIKSALERASEDVADAAAQLELLLEQVPQTHQLEQSEVRLFALRAAARKYHTQVDNLADLLASTKQQLQDIENQEEALDRAEKAILQAKQQFLAAADALNSKRRKAAAQCEKAILKELVPLKMEKTKLQFQFEPLAETSWSEAGNERVVIHASTNEGVPLAPLAAIASGGELSRLMLAIKVVLRKNTKAGLYVFDEIDTGTGGAVADAIGARLQALSKAGQVLVVTHAPQVAARGAHHLFISKSTSKGKTLTSICPLNQEQRMDELARMLSGSEITSEARSAAKRLLSAAS